MAWFKCCDTLFSNHKVMQAWTSEPAAMGLWIIAGTWSASQELDGFVPEHMVNLWASNGTELGLVLEDAGLWKRDAAQAGWRFHDFLDYNPSKEELAERRAKESARKAGGSRKESARKVNGIREAVNGPVPVPVPVTTPKGVVSARATSISAKQARNRRRLGLDEGA